MSEKSYRIIHEDEWLLGIDKPSGMLVIPTPKKETNTLTDLINKDLDERGIAANAYPCHRLDKDGVPGEQTTRANRYTPR